MTAFTKEWTDWIDLNINSGCDKDGIFKILLDEGYSFEQIKNQMNYSPTMNMSHVQNPHRKSENLEIAQDSPEVLYLSNAVRLETEKAEFYVIDNFLNQKECDQMIKLIGDMKRPSLMVNHGDKEDNFRTSSTCDLGELDSPFIKEIDERICKMMGINGSYSEPIQGQFYEIGQEFKAHTDYFEEDEIEECDGGQGQRTYSFFINLNDVEEGGTTYFPALELEHTPKRGTAVIWNNLLANGKGNYNSLHHGKPVLKGNKSVITKWFRSKGFGSMMTKTPHEKIPNFTSIGFEKSQLPDEILKAIKRFYQDNITDQKAEFVEGGYIQGKNKSCAPSSLLDLPPYLKK